MNWKYIEGKSTEPPTCTKKFDDATNYIADCNLNVHAYRNFDTKENTDLSFALNETGKTYKAFAYYQPQYINGSNQVAPSF